MSLYAKDYGGPRGIDFVRGLNAGDLLVWNPATNSWETISAAPLTAGDLSSIVPGNLYGREWHAAVPAHYPLLQGGLRSVLAGAFDDAVGINIDANATNFGQLTRYFSVPAGVTHVELSVALKRLLPATPSAPLLELWSGQLGALLQSTVCNLAAGWATYSTGPVPVVPGTDFTARIAVGPGLTGGGQQSCYAGRISATPTGGAGIWSRPFRRFNVDPRALHDNGYSAIPDPHFWYATQYARFVIDTNATELAIEFFDSLAPTIPVASSAIGIIVNGRPYTSVAPAAGSLINQFATVALPAGQKRVEIVTGPAFNQTGNIATAIGNWLVAVYVPADAQAEIVLPQSERPLVIYGDSIASGYFASQPVLNGWPALLRNAYPSSVVSESWGGRALFYDAPVTVDALVTQLAKYDGERYWLAIGRNDWASSLWLVATFATRYGELLDALHAARPSATIYAQSPIFQTVAGANANGETLAQFRAAVQAAAAARAWCVFVDGTAIISGAGQLIDGVHPNDIGSAGYAAAVMTTVGT